MPQPTSSADRHKRLADAVRQCENVYSQAATAPLHVHGLFGGDVSYSKQHLATVSAAGSLATMERRIQELQLQLSAMDLRLQEVTANQQGAGMAPGFFGASSPNPNNDGKGGSGGGVSDRYFTTPEVQFVRKITSDMLRPLWEASKHQERLLLDVISTLNFAVENRAFIGGSGGGGGNCNKAAPSSRHQQQHYNHRDQEMVAAADNQLDGELEDRIFNLKRTAHLLRSGTMLGDPTHMVANNNNNSNNNHPHNDGADAQHQTPVYNTRQPSSAPSYDMVVSPETVASAIVRDIHPRASSTGTTATTSSSTAGYRQPSSTPTTATTTTTTTSGGTTTATSDEEAFFKGFSRKANDYRQYFPSSGGGGDSERFRRLLDITSSSEDDFLSNRNPHSPHWRQHGGGERMPDPQGGGDSSTTTSSGQKAGQETSFVEAVRHIVSGDLSPQGGAATAGQRSVHFGEETVFTHPTDRLGTTTATATTTNTEFNTSNPQHHQTQTTNASNMNPSFVTLLNPTSAGSNTSMSKTDVSGGGGGGTTLHQTAFTSGFDTTPIIEDSMVHNTSDGSVVSAVVPSTANTSGVVISGGGGGGDDGRRRGGGSNHDQSGGYADAYRALDAHVR